jgi:hypothetical protein
MFEEWIAINGLGTTLAKLFQDLLQDFDSGVTGSDVDGISVSLIRQDKLD